MLRGCCGYLGIGGRDGVQQRPGSLDVPDFRVTCDLQAVEVGEVSLGVHDRLAGDRVAHLVEFGGQYGASCLCEAGDGLCAAFAVDGHESGRVQSTPSVGELCERVGRIGPPQHIVRQRGVCFFP